MSKSIHKIHQPYFDHPDSVAYMMLRRTINEEYAETRRDFNVLGLQVGATVLGRALLESDTIIDIGSSNGTIIAQAAKDEGLDSHIICVEPSEEGASSFAKERHTRASGVTFLQAYGEKIPLRASSADGATLHNVIFRSPNAVGMLQEVQRVVKPGGFIAVSTNYEGHARERHQFEARITREFFKHTGVKLDAVRPPAEAHYVTDLPRLFIETGNLDVGNLMYVHQDTHAVITPGERLETYLTALKFSAVDAGVPDDMRGWWRFIVEKIARAKIEREMQKSPEGTFLDTIHRGMYVVRNIKSDD